jgi:AraC-like DNA-binding protein
MSKTEDGVANPDQDVPLIHFDMSRPPKFLSCGRFIAPEGWVHRERVIDSWELIMGLNGTAWLEEEGRRYALGAEDMLFFRPGLRHRGYQASREGSSFYWVHFVPWNECATAAATSQGKEPFPAPVSLPVWLPRLGLDKARVTMTQLQDAPESPHSSVLISSYLCGSLLLEIQRAWGERHAPAPGLGGQADSWFTRLLDWARIQLDRPLNVEDLARQAGKHPDYLARLFKKYLGIGPLAWLHRERMEKAKKMLMETDLTIKQIAWRLGFSDSRQFSRLFRQSEALTPSDWRNIYSRMHLNRE